MMANILSRCMFEISDAMANTRNMGENYDPKKAIMLHPFGVQAYPTHDPKTIVVGALEDLEEGCEAYRPVNISGSRE